MKEKRREDQEKMKMKEEMKEKREDEREDEREERRYDVVEKRLKPKNPPDEKAHHDSKKCPPDELFVRKFRISPVFSIIYMVRIRIFGPRELIQNEFSDEQ